MVSTILTSFIIVVVMNMPSIISYFTQDELKTFGVVDPSNRMGPTVQTVSKELVLQDITFIPIGQESTAKKQIEDEK